MMWVAQRANYSNPRLTRTVDLRDVATATLEYAVYADIEQGYDFGYVSVSVDNGRTWQTKPTTCRSKHNVPVSRGHNASPASRGTSRRSVMVTMKSAKVVLGPS